MSYLRAGEARAAAWEISTRFAGSIEASGTGGSRVPWLGKGGLTRCREDELWAPQVFAITVAWMDEGFRRGGCCLRGEVT